MPVLTFLWDYGCRRNALSGMAFEEQPRIDPAYLAAENCDQSPIPAMIAAMSAMAQTPMIRVIGP